MDSSLRTAARAALEAMEKATRFMSDSDYRKLNESIDALRAALADGDNLSPGEPVQEPVAYSVGRTLHWHQGLGVTDAQLYIVPPQRPAESKQDVKGCDHCEHPLYAAIKCRVCGRVTEPQRKPLSEAKIKKLLAESAGMTVQFSDIDLRLARAVERAHGIGDRT